MLFLLHHSFCLYVFVSSFDDSFYTNLNKVYKAVERLEAQAREAHEAGLALLESLLNEVLLLNAYTYFCFSLIRILKSNCLICSYLIHVTDTHLLQSNDLRSGGPMRRIQQNANLYSQVSSLSKHKSKFDSSSQRLILSSQPEQKASKAIVENGETSKHNSCYAFFPTESTQMASVCFSPCRMIWTEMQNDFLPNFILCNTTQRFVRSSKVPSAPVQKPSLPYAKPNFYCGTQITTLEPMVTVLQEALPKSIALHPFDGGVTVPVAVCLQFSSIMARR
ncbi:protein PIR [Tanacetum coccineum]